jgi:hypothetical protein
MLMFVVETGLCFDGVISKLYTKRYINALVRVEASDSTGNTVHQARIYENTVQYHLVRAYLACQGHAFS